jgi:hypothetical protein
VPIPRRRAQGAARRFAFGGRVGAPSKVAGVAQPSAKDARRFAVGRVFDRASATAGAGAFSLTFRPSRKVARKLRGARKLLLTVAVTSTPTAGGAPVRSTRTVTLGR